MLNGVQLGVMLFLLAAGLTLIFGIMGVLNLAHGSLYMIGAYGAAWAAAKTGSFWLAIPAGLAAAAIAGILIRADKRSLHPAPLTQLLREHRRATSPAGDDMIDALIGVLSSR